jgi:hypothetical protein
MLGPTAEERTDGERWKDLGAGWARRTPGTIRARLVPDGGMSARHAVVGSRLIARSLIAFIQGYDHGPSQPG